MSTHGSQRRIWTSYRRFFYPRPGQALKRDRVRIRRARSGRGTYAAAECDALRSQVQRPRPRRPISRKASQRRVQASSESLGTPPGSGLQHLTSKASSSTTAAWLCNSSRIRRPVANVGNGIAGRALSYHEASRAGVPTLSQPRDPAPKQTAIAITTRLPALDRNHGHKQTHQQLG